MGAFHRSKNALGFFVKAHCEILDVNIALGLIDFLPDTRDIRRVVRQEFDSIPSEVREATQNCIEPTDQALWRG